MVKKGKKKGKEDNEIPENVAIIIIDKAKVEDMDDITRELEIMNDLKHKYIVHLYEIFDVPRRDPAPARPLPPSPHFPRLGPPPARCRLPRADPGEREGWSRRRSPRR